MATSRRSTKNETSKKNEAIKLPQDFILHWRENEYGLFGLEHNGALIYGCRLVERRDGGVFVSYPSRKGNDGKYYCHARFTEDIPDEVVEAIADAIGF